MKHPTLSDRPLTGRPDDLAAENRELHRLRALEKAARVVAHPRSGFTTVEQAVARFILGTAS